MGVDWWGPLIGFASGVGVSIVAAVIGAALEQRGERPRRRERAAFNVYMQLLDLNGSYFWIASNELHGIAPSPEVEKKVRDLAWRIADALRKCDEIPYMDEIIRILMNESAYASANDRAKALDMLLEKLGAVVNPRYMKAIGAASVSNLLGSVDRPLDSRPNAPGNMGML